MQKKKKKTYINTANHKREEKANSHQKKKRETDDECNEKSACLAGSDSQCHSACSNNLCKSTYCICQAAVQHIRMHWSVREQEDARGSN